MSNHYVDTSRILYGSAHRWGQSIIAQKRKSIFATKFISRTLNFFIISAFPSIIAMVLVFVRAKYINAHARWEVGCSCMIFCKNGRCTGQSAAGQVTKRGTVCSVVALTSLVMCCILKSFDCMHSQV